VQGLGGRAGHVPALVYLGTGRFVCN